MTPRCAREKNIFVHHGLHFTCAVIYMEQMKIKYYDSLRYDNLIRHCCRHKVKMQEDKLQVLRDYLQNKHMKYKHMDLSNEWKIYYVQ